MLTREDILQFLRDNKERFAEQYGVTKIGLIGFRNTIAHDYFGIDEDVLFANCQTHLPLLLATVNRMIENLEKNRAQK